jgi:hypothetical protein
VKEPEKPQDSKKAAWNAGPASLSRHAQALNAPHLWKQILSGVAFYHVPTCARRQRGPLKPAGIVLTHNDNVHWRKLTLEDSRGVQPIHGGHGDIEQHKVRVMLPRLLDSVGPVHSLADHFDISLGMKYLADTSTHTFVVIHH